ncbi:hypothetical protein MTER_31530 [Mycolicibacter terrae]|uniref:DUF2563 family protein n=1 Tax=Mycolicibacter terrae TaxID=1788 RepID=A0AAD1MGK8_9MYCO|nr:DUF2563 family protein [Mycolicibacter terrae]ORW88653.1 hypothetical protein AWC28_05510 [Mycolicibacter terrae]BBX23742.1 hypothetical protein MTER_31530 [Mycolicibacter terrae]SNV60372.1 Protein of uncharacterised function (DUF2563) [Mycolicibacter terrae]
MHVNPQVLRIGANVSDDAGQHADTGSQRLGLAGVATGIFGDFDAAHTFHAALGSAKDGHRDVLRAHHHNLTGIAENVRTAATAFTRMDDHNATLLRDIPGRGTGQ